MLNNKLNVIRTCSKSGWQHVVGLGLAMHTLLLIDKQLAQRTACS